MFFDFLGWNKHVESKKSDNKFKVSAAPPEKLLLDFQSDDDIGIILGENIKKSKYTPKHFDEPEHKN